MLNGPWTLWPTALAITVLAVIGAQGSHSRRLALIALTVWLGSAALYQLGLGTEPLPARGSTAPGWDLLAWLVASAVPLLCAALVLRLRSGAATTTRAALSFMMGLVVLTPMPLVMLTLHCLSGDCL